MNPNPTCELNCRFIYGHVAKKIPKYLEIE
jgi:hypothetical protein